MNKDTYNAYHNTLDTMRVHIYTFNDLWQFYVCIYIPLMICGGSTMQ